MKKYIFLVVLCAMALGTHAQVAFLLRESNVESLDDGTDYSERAAAAWFKTEFVDTGKGAFVMTDSIPTDASTYQVMWINIDDNGSGALPAAFTSDVITAIETYVKAGGNLLLTKRANRILCEIGRMKKDDNSQYEPSEEWRDACRTFVNAKIAPSIQLRDASEHPIYKNVPLYNSEAGHFLLANSVASPDKGYIWTEMYRKDGGKSDNNNIANLNDFQSNWACQVLAVWGSVADYIAPVIVEFFPQGDYKGSILSIGTASYKWGSNNNSNIANVKTLTSNALNYLSQGGSMYGYYMPYTLSELYSLNGEDGTYKPDYEAAKWFYENYVTTGKGRFIHKEESIPTDMKVLWVNNDRSSYTDRVTYYNDCGGSDFITKLENYVKAGGNLFLSKQATRLANDIGRISVAPDYRYNGWTEGDDNARYMTADFYALKDADENRVGLDRHNHSVYKYLPAEAWVIHNEHGEDVYCKWQLMDFTNANRRTDNNAIWENWDGYTEDQDAVHLARATKFEEDHHCVILGGYGHTTALDGVGFVEFYPYGDYKGTVIALGLHSYEWGTNNSLVSNVQNLTKGVLRYFITADPKVPGCDNCFYITY